MKRNWIVIAAVAGFILVYELAIVRPYMQKYSAQKAVVNAQATIAAATSQNSVATDPKVTMSPTTTPEPSTNTAWNSSLQIDLAPKRKLTISGGARLGPLTLEDYFVRESKEKTHVQIQVEPLFWTSSNPDVQNCFSSLDKSTNNDLLFERTTSAGTCRVIYYTDAQRPHVLSATVELNGFVGAAGFLELNGQGKLGHSKNAQDHNTLSWKLDGSTSWMREKDVFKGETKDGQVSWLAWGDKYFGTILLPKGQFNPTLVKTPTQDAELAQFGFRYPLVQKSGETTKYETDIYFGTRDPEILLNVAPAASDAMDLGFFAKIAKAMVWGLKKINLFANNYGVSIILLTLLVRALFWPLNKKVYSSGIKMKAIQPQLDALKKKYSGDTSKAMEMNKETFALYKKHGVNPMGSCLPLLAQMPIFIGLYGALGHSLELYQAPFVGWIADLSSKDPLYIFPALWTLSLFAFVKLNPQQQQAGMPNMIWFQYGMNFLFGFMSKDWPSGLTLYLFVSNLVGIAQQLMLKRAASLKPVQEGV